jgi:hypothetical protein
MLGMGRLPGTPEEDLGLQHLTRTCSESSVAGPHQLVLKLKQTTGSGSLMTCSPDFMRGVCGMDSRGWGSVPAGARRGRQPVGHDQRLLLVHPRVSLQGCPSRSRQPRPFQTGYRIRLHETLKPRSAPKHITACLLHQEQPSILQE